MSNKSSETTITATTESRIDAFEESLTELESLVEKMEAGELSLEESLQQFERGVVLARGCQTALKEAELKVRILIEKNGGQALEDFDDADTPA
jgi:exodeoxyribonuclease VII small subunit